MRAAAWWVLPLWLGGCVGGPAIDDSGETDDTAASDALLGLGVSPNGAIARVGETVAYTAKAFYADTTNEVVTGQVTWTSTEARVATISGGGVATALAAGETEIVATDADGVSAKVLLTVTAADVVPTSVTLSPPSVTLKVAETLEIEAIANFSDGTAGNVSGSCTFASDAAAIVAMTGAEARGVAVGTTTIRATCGALSASAGARVEAAGGGTTSLPNLRISDALVDGADGAIDVLIEVENTGNANAGGFYVDLFLDPPAAPVAGDAWDDAIWVSGVAAGQTKLLYGSFLGVSTGTHQVWAYADPEDYVDESSETNNRGGPYTAVLTDGGANAPQLTVTAFSGLSDGSYTLYDVQIRNNGPTAATGFYVDLWYDQVDDPFPCDYGDDFLYVGSLAPGASLTWEPDVVDGPFLWWDSIVYVDSCDDVVESDETDNLDYTTIYPD